MAMTLEVYPTDAEAFEATAALAAERLGGAGPHPTVALGSGRGGPGYGLPGEPSNDRWGLGAVGMARVPGGAINGSQFFIEKAAWPDPGPTAVYNRFGTVISGMDKAQLVQTTDTITSITIKASLTPR